MAIDNTHTKYLHGADKKAWNNYKDALEAQKKYENFGESLTKGIDIEKLAEGEVRTIPLNNNKNK